MAHMDNNTPAHSSTVVSPEDNTQPRDRSAWLQFPRRAVLLIAACAIAVFLLRLWPLPAVVPGGLPGPSPSAPISTAALERLPNSLLLLTLALAIAVLLSLLVAVVAMAVAFLQARSPRLGSVLDVVGRLALFTWMPLPVALIAFILLLLFLAGPFVPAGFSAVGDNASTLLLASVSLALYPALLAAQDGARLFAATDTLATGRRLLATLLQLGQALLLQTAGLLSALTVVELIFARPGLGRLVVQSAAQRNATVMLDALVLMAFLVLLGRLAAELLGWGRRLILQADATPRPAQSAAQRNRVWTIFAALLLFLPLALVVAGLLTGPDAAVQQDLQQRLAPPSLQHPLGTDALGRDVWARLRLGGLNTLARGALVAGAAVLPVLALGLLAGAIFNRGGWLWESLADFLLLPIDALLFLPLVPAAVAFIALGPGPGASTALVLALALLFLPRAARAARDTWRARQSGDNPARDVLAMLASLFLLLLFNVFLVLFALEYTGFGPAPPTPSLGQLLQETQPHLRAAPGAAVALILVLSLPAFALYTAAAAIGDFVSSRRPLVRFNE